MLPPQEFALGLWIDAQPLKGGHTFFSCMVSGRYEYCTFFQWACMVFQQLPGDQAWQFATHDLGVNWIWHYRSTVNLGADEPRLGVYLSSETFIGDFIFDYNYPIVSLYIIIYTIYVSHFLSNILSSCFFQSWNSPGMGFILVQSWHVPFFGAEVQ